MNLPLIDSSPITESLSALAEIPKQPETYIEVTIRIPIRDVDFSQCTCEEQFDKGEFAGAPYIERYHEIDLRGAVYVGGPVACEVNSTFEKTAEHFIKMERGIY